MIDSLKEPDQPGQMAPLIEWCAYWKAMDRFYQTPKRSPLHHNNRCDLCRGRH